MSETPITDVGDTSFWVAYYRALETERPDALFRDPFAKRLVGNLGKKISDSMPKVSRYTQWSVVSRTVIIDRFIEKLIKNEGVDGILNLGAGLDTRPYRMNLPASLKWIEVDYSRIIKHKSDHLKDEKPICNLTRFEVDLANDQLRKQFLNEILPDSKKVLVLTEGVIPYLTSDQVSSLGKDLFQQQRFAFWITEYFHPRVYRHLQKSVRTKMMKNAPFQFYPPDWFGFFNALGWKEQETGFASDVAKEFGRRQPLPWFAYLLIPLMPKKVKEQMARMMGYTLLNRAP